MKTLSTALVALFLCLTAAPARVEDADAAAIRRMVQYYFDGVDHNSIDSLRKAFHPDAKLMSIEDGKLMQLPVEEWYTRLQQRKGPAPQATRRIAQLEVTGTVAQVKADAQLSAARVTDYLSLARSTANGRW